MKYLILLLLLIGCSDTISYKGYKPETCYKYKNRFFAKIKMIRIDSVGESILYEQVDIGFNYISYKDSPLEPNSDMAHFGYYYKEKVDCSQFAYYKDLIVERQKLIDRVKKLEDLHKPKKGKKK